MNVPSDMIAREVLDVVPDHHAYDPGGDAQPARC